MKKKVVFVCIHNSARSQMAEEILRQLAGDRFEVDSAGIEPGTLNPRVIEVLKEIDIDISGKKTKSVDQLIAKGKEFDYIITVCDEASAERCPIFPGFGTRLHWGFEDPSSFQNDADAIEKTRIIRDLIKSKIESWLTGS
ncbi:MAG: arsenate reductase [Omnitrophica WOR_2 bacterium RIFOXYB2_FULL_38_16]|nr:MAG: arsenate reductase [Omnitrophica WOR_2 bacterium RIFOXYA2_FULL_38_17]OGX50937.1 MAG: arsenate reductase [Omnitrophica WOR_2 bacterium RIFOXYA12_FULL_38_10]OGX55600.1 MAG: arsenate reductase [Omnitrophica WOR_2 bacterium RIFOXYB2_FULL_38_16]OGX56776.1 MAG: arsenate reductase [Omnitrophica WOR_2 bacterium RIFOXYC2_FULL_38_12]